MRDTETFLVLDYETYSEADIKKVGAWEYSLHPSTEILCAGFTLGTREELASKPVYLWINDGRVDPLNGASFSILLSALRNPKIKVVATNALFEQVITKNVLGRRLMSSKPELQNIPVSRWFCTAALARVLGLPGNLEGHGAALDLPIQKDKEGHKIMLKVCKPKKPSKKDPSTRHTKTEDLERLYEYCKRDVKTEALAFLKLPPMHPRVREFWEMDQRLNMRGFAVDRPLVLGALKLIAKESARLDKRVQVLTNGALNSARQRDAVLKFVRKLGVELPDLRAPTIKEYLETPDKLEDTEDGQRALRLARKILEIREAISRSSTAKYKAFEARTRFDGRARDTLVFNGAHTGRDAGSGLQPQNLFKSVFKHQSDVETGIELMRRGDAEAIEALYEKPMDLYASALRSCIVAAPGKTLEVGDFATIEVRVLFWLAGYQRGLDALASGRDLYCDMAEKIFGVPAEKIKEGHKAGVKEYVFMRQVGKHAVLGSGFGMGLGGEKFQAMCAQFGVEVSLDLAKRAVKAYRELHARIPAFWSNLEKAATLALTNPGKAYRVGYLVWKKEGDFLTCQLPLGRKLHYFKPDLRKVRTLYGEKLCITFMANIKGKLYREKTWGGTLTENVVQAVAADLMKESLLRLEKAGHTPVLAVHDEAVCEVEKASNAAMHQANVNEFERIMAEVPEWARGLPISVEAWSETRYRK